jgi:hypothetical protein
MHIQIDEEGDIQTFHVKKHSKKHFKEATKTMFHNKFDQTIKGKGAFITSM